MKLHHMALAAMTSAIWGLAFVATKLALQSYSASQLIVLRFLIASVPILVVRRPAVSWRMLVAVGLTLFTGQFLLLFLAFECGLPPGLASVTQQMQVFFTVALSAAWLGDLPGIRQCTGMAIAFGGLLLIGLTVGADLRPLALALALGGAFSWAVGNVLVKRLSGVAVFPLIVWASLVPPLPVLALSELQGERALWDAVASASWAATLGAVYLGAVATLAYAIWGRLLQRFSAGAVAPFALLSPCVGVLASAVVFGEVFAPIRYAGMALVLAGVVVAMAPGDCSPTKRA